MKCKYQINAEVWDDGATVYRFNLVNTETGAVVGTARSRAPIAPKQLRDKQARLNTQSYLDQLLHS